MNYFTRYQTNNRSSLDIFQAFEIIVNKTQGRLSEAIRAMTCFDTLTRVQACSEAAINLALMVDAIEQGALEGNPQDILEFKKICALFVEMISRANIQEDRALFERVINELETFKGMWIRLHQNQTQSWMESSFSSASGL